MSSQIRGDFAVHQSEHIARQGVFEIRDLPITLEFEPACLYLLLCVLFFPKQVLL